MIDLASYIVEVSLESKKYLTPLHLQRVIYYTILQGLKQGLLTKDDLMELYKEEVFVPSRFGPKLELVYLKYCIFGASRIFTNYFPKEPAGTKNFPALKSIILSLLDQKTSVLIQESKNNPIFKKRFEENSIFSIEDIIQLSEKYSDLK